MDTSTGCSQADAWSERPSEIRSDVANGAADARLQDHRELSQGHGKAILRVCSQFVVLCRALNLFSQEMVAIDGSKFKAVNNRDRNFTSAKMQRRMQQIEESIERYLAQLDTADRQEPSEVQDNKRTRLQDKISSLKQQMHKLKELEVRMLQAPDK